MRCVRAIFLENETAAENGESKPGEPGCKMKKENAVEEDMTMHTMLESNKTIIE